jgi:long-chain acyl-CoA synthetase
MEKDWLKHYDDGVPHTLEPYPEQTLLDMVSDAARQRPEHRPCCSRGRRCPTGS